MQKSATFIASVLRINYLLLQEWILPLTSLESLRTPTHQWLNMARQYLRWALMQAARLASVHCDTFRLYMNTKLAQGKHYFIALGHVSKKLVRFIFRILTTNEAFVPQA